MGGRRPFVAIRPQSVHRGVTATVSGGAMLRVLASPVKGRRYTRLRDYTSSPTVDWCPRPIYGIRGIGRRRQLLALASSAVVGGQRNVNDEMVRRLPPVCSEVWGMRALGIHLFPRSENRLAEVI